MMTQFSIPNMNDKKRSNKNSKNKQQSELLKPIGSA